MIDRPKDLCDSVNEWGDSVDPVFCTLFVSMVIFVLVFMMGLLVPVVAFFLLGPAMKAVKVEEITSAVTESLRRKIENLRNTTATYLATAEEPIETVPQTPGTTTTLPSHWMSPNRDLGAIPRRGDRGSGGPPTGPKPASVSTSGPTEEIPLTKIQDIYDEICVTVPETDADLGPDAGPKAKTDDGAV